MAEKNKNKILFAHSSITTGIGEKLAEYIGVTENDSGCIRIISFDEENLKKYIIDGNTEE